MLLNSNEIINRGLIHPIIDKNQIQQVGVDLTLKTIKKINGGTLKCEGKKILPFTEFKPIQEIDEYGKVINYYLLAHLQAYSITFNEECIIPPDATGFLIHRSTLARIGGIIHSAVFDPGYYSEGGIGGVLYAFENIKIEQNARVAQMIFHKNTTVSTENLYNGSYQGVNNIK